MSKELIEFIKLCLVDSVITEKERTVIFKKAKALGVDEDECEIILESMIYEANKSQNPNDAIKIEQPICKNPTSEYFLPINIGDDLDSRIIELKFGKNETELVDEFKESYVAEFYGFGMWDTFWSDIQPQDSVVQKYQKIYAQDTLLRQTIIYPNGDSYEGSLKDNKKNGKGVFLQSTNISFKRPVRFVGDFQDDIFLSGFVDVYIDDFSSINWESTSFDRFHVILNNGVFSGNLIDYSNGDRYEGDIHEFKKHGKGIFTKSNGEIITGEWKDDKLIKAIVTKESLYQKIAKFYDNNDFSNVIKEVDSSSSEINQIEFYSYKNIAKMYLWSLYKMDVNKAFGKIDFMLQITNEKEELYDPIGCILRQKGEIDKDIIMLTKAIGYYEKCNYNDKEFGKQRIKKTKETIEKIKKEKEWREMEEKEWRERQEMLNTPFAQAILKKEAERKEAAELEKRKKELNPYYDIGLSLLK